MCISFAPSESQVQILMNKTLHLSRREALWSVQSNALNHSIGHLESLSVILLEIPWQNVELFIQEFILKPKCFCDPLGRVGNQIPSRALRGGSHPVKITFQSGVWLHPAQHSMEGRVWRFPGNRQQECSYRSGELLHFRAEIIITVFPNFLSSS